MFFLFRETIKCGGVGVGCGGWVWEWGLGVGVGVGDVLGDLCRDPKQTNNYGDPD